LSPAINLSMGPREWGMLLIFSILWGGSFYFVDVAVNELPTFTIVFLRVRIAALGLHLILRIVGELISAGLAIWRTFFIMGFLNNLVPFSLIAWGQSHVASGLASIILATYHCRRPFHDRRRAPLGRAAGRHRGRYRRRCHSGRLGILARSRNRASCPYRAARRGAVLFLRRRIRTPLPAHGGDAARHRHRADHRLQRPLVAARTCRLPALDSGHAERRHLARHCRLALLSTSLAYILYFRILAAAGATNLLLVTFLILVSAIILGAAFLAQRLQANHFIGMAVIDLGLAAIDGRIFKQLQRMGNKA